MNLINTKMPAPRQMEMLLSSLVSTAYYYNVPYPRYAFGPQQWPLDRGPCPTSLPIVTAIVDEGSAFVFKGGSPSFAVQDDPAATELLREIITANGLESQYVSVATAIALQGAVAVKWSLDMSQDCPVRLTFLSIPNECRIYLDPHDQTRVLMARISYYYRDMADGHWYGFREEWTNEEYVTYQPLLVGDRSISDPLMISGYMDDMGDSRDWQIDKREVNPFGLIPVSVIRNNVVKGVPLGEPTCLKILRIVDRIALSLHNEDFANQFLSQPVTAFINAIPENVGPLSPGEPISVMTAEGSAGTADVKLLSHDGGARLYSHQDMDRWMAMIYKAVGLSMVTAEEVSNKGSLSEQTLTLLYQATVATSDMRRELWGNSGLAVLFRNLLIGLSRVVTDRRLSALTERPQITVSWPPYFSPTDSDLSAVTDRTVTQVDNDLLSHEEAITRVGQAENMDDNQIESMKAELIASKKAKMIAAMPGIADGADLGAGPAAQQALGANNFVA